MNILQRSFYIWAGLALTFASVIFLSVAVAQFSKPEKVATPSSVRKKLEKECTLLARDFNYEASTVKGDIYFSSNDLMTWERDLANYSVIIQSCKGFKLKTFCMGSGCKGKNKEPFSGTIMSLSLIKSDD